MDARTFDRLSRVLVSSGSRRRLLGLLTGLSIGEILSGGSETAAKPGRTRHRQHAKRGRRHRSTHRRTDHREDAEAEACIPTGQRCPAKKARGKKGRKLGCSKCCQGSFITEASGKKVCGCQPNGGSCTDATAASCCSGFCNGSTCQAAPCSAAIPCPQCQTCSATTGLCEAVANGTACNDGDACTQADTCQDGLCVGGNLVTCTAPPPCHTATDASCNPVSGQCDYPTSVDGSSCAGGTGCCNGVCCSGGTPVCVNNVCDACSAHSQCASDQLCDGGACQPCTVTCPSGNPTTCGNALQAAITAAVPGDTLYVCPGTYKSPPNTDPLTTSDRGFLIEGAGKRITIIGAGQDGDEATATILHANPGGTTDSRRAMTIDSGVDEVSLAGLRITGGANVTSGGGIFNSDGTLRLTACTVADNRAFSQGGGIFIAIGSLLMTECSLVGNHVTGIMAGGGGGIETGGAVTLTNCTLSGNTSTNSGGGIRNNAPGQTITLDGTVIGPGNTAINGGGGIDNLRGTLNLVHASQVTGNHAGASDGGGGISNGSEGIFTISSNSSVTGNTAGDPPMPNNCEGTAPTSGTCGPP